MVMAAKAAGKTHKTTCMTLPAFCAGG
jgi:hypothetical protein